MRTKNTISVTTNATHSMICNKYIVGATIPLLLALIITSIDVHALSAFDGSFVPVPDSWIDANIEVIQHELKHHSFIFVVGYPHSGKVS